MPATDRTRAREKLGSRVRNDIQGLRALAVGVVILDHLVHWPTGGFVGVDIFFVISGFLITGLLLREYGRTGRISFRGFYVRRVRRILPAATLVLFATVAGSFLLLNNSRSMQVLEDAAWSFFFSANWHFAAVGTDYFASDGPLSPLQHFWSLGVEEQFYFVWPWLMLLLLSIGGRAALAGEDRGRRAAGVTMLAIVACSFAWSVWETAHSPAIAYFSTLSRAWELGVGALLAIFSGVLERIPSVVRPAMAWAGLAGIALSVGLITGSSSFPAPWAALPVLSAALVIAAGTAGEQKFLWPLTNRVSRYAGDISYSLYLWHFPVIVFCAALLPPTGRYRALAAVVIVVLAIVSYHLVENPVRRSRWLAPRAPGEVATSRRGALAAGVVAVVLALASVAGWVLHAPPPSMGATGGEVVDSGPVGNLQQRMAQSLAMTVWPQLHPSLEQLGRTALAPEWVEDGCLGEEQNADPDWRENSKRCVYGPADADHKAVLIGDSVGISWMPAIRSALGEDWSVRVIAMQQCPIAEFDTLQGNQAPHPECSEFRSWAESEVEQLQPDLVVLSSYYQTLLQPDHGLSPAATEAAWRAGLTHTLEGVAPNAARTVVLAAPPNGSNILECMTAFNTPKDCVSGPWDYYRDIVDAEEAVIAQLNDPSVSYHRTVDWFCTAESVCPPIVGDVIVRADSIHLTASYSSSLGSVMRLALLPEGTTP